jgi:chitobiase/beta-hexosaminidase-like protein
VSFIGAAERDSSSEWEKKKRMNANPCTLGPPIGRNPSSVANSCATVATGGGAASARPFFEISNFRFAILTFLLCLIPGSLSAQVSVLTQRGDISRSGVNASETVLTPANVNTTQFGQLFSYSIDGYAYAQPLYMPGVTINGVTHNVVFIATEHDSVFAFDADSDAGANAAPLWQITLLDAAHGAAPGASTVPNEDTDSGDLTPEIGITSTPVIDPSTGTIYVEGKTNENGGYVQRLHALDITSGAEKFGGPAVLAASVPGTGNGSSNGVLNFDPLWQLQRTGLLLLNGIVYMGFGSHGDMGPWHGWILAYNATTLQQTGAFCTSANGTGGGIWMAGTGLAADVIDPVNHPYGRMFVPTGNGSFDAATPYTNAMSYGDTAIAFDLTNGALTVTDSFTPYNQETLSENDLDLASAGLIILPNQTTGPTHVLFQAGKQGTLYVINRDNLGGNNATTDNVIQEVTGQNNGLWSAPTYFNNAIYLWGTNDDMKAYTFINGVLESSYFTSSNESASYPGPTTVASANGTSNGIIWTIQADQSPEILRAYDPTNLNNLLYSSNQNADRDTPGSAVKFTIPTIANGKVYVASQTLLSVYGILPVPAATPGISPASESFANSVQVTLTDGTTGASIFYTTDGSTPSGASTQYTAPITLTATTTINAIATATGALPSAVATATFTLEPPAATPMFSPAPGTYTAAQHVTLSDTTSGASIYYTTNGTTPSTSSTKYAGAITVSATETIQAIATATSSSYSEVASATYTIETPAATPTFSPVAGTYTSAQQVTISDDTSGAAIFYTTNGATPTASSTQYTGAVTVSATTTIKAIATAAGSLTSAVATAAYTIETPAATPVFSPAAGTYTAAQKVTITDSTTGSSIFYTTDGSTPTASSTKYTAAITVSATTTINAIATATGSLNSAMATATYTIETPAATPVFSPAAGTYDGAQQVTISDDTTGASIFYSTNDTTPTASSTKYSGPITVTDTTTIKAIATASGSLTSAVATAAYKIEPTTATPTFSPAAGTYPSAQQVTIKDSTVGATIYYTTNGSTPTTLSTKYSAAITVSTTTTINAIAKSGFDAASPVASATYSIDTEAAAATPTFSPAAGSYTTAQQVTISDSTAGAAIYYTTNGATPTTSSTRYTSAITVSATTTIKAIATATGMSNSAVATATYTIGTETAVATPTFSPAAGTYSTAQQVTISDSTAGAAIYYTTNGTTPTASSTRYTGAITVSATTTIKAIATASGMTNSAVANAVYTIKGFGVL